MERYEVVIHESFTYSVPVEAVNEAAAANTAFSLEWVTPSDEVVVLHQKALIKEIKEAGK